MFARRMLRYVIFPTARNFQCLSGSKLICSQHILTSIQITISVISDLIASSCKKVVRYKKNPPELWFLAFCLFGKPWYWMPTRAVLKATRNMFYYQINTRVSVSWAAYLFYVFSSCLNRKRTLPKQREWESEVQILHWKVMCGSSVSEWNEEKAITLSLRNTLCKRRTVARSPVISLSRMVSRPTAHEMGRRDVGFISRDSNASGFTFDCFSTKSPHIKCLAHRKAQWHTETRS